MGLVVTMRFFAALVAVVLAACGMSNATADSSSLTGDDAFVRVARTSQALTVDAGTDGYVTANDENFYLAIKKSELGQKWFLSAYLTQWHPSENLPVRSLGTRVVRFKVQNDTLYVFDATDGAKWSDVLDPTIVIEAYPLVKDNAAFNATPGANGYVLVDPSAGLNRFDVVADDFAASYQVRFQVDLSYLQRFRVLADGVSYEQVFTGYSEAAGPGILGWDQPFRGSGTMSMSLRRYAEGAGFQSAALQSNQYFGSSNIQYVPNQPTLKQNAVKWNIKPGMQPIPWRITKSIDRLKNDPRLAGIDIEGAIARGVTGWNDAFGFPVFTVVTTAATDSFGDDDKNFIVVDTNPGAGLAFANWRENPNTGEIRGASVYFSSVFVEAALQAAVDADGGVVPPVVVDAGTGAVDAGVAPTFCAPELVISQVFGGNSMTSIRNQDFVVIHNRGTNTVSLEGLSLQYGSASGTAWQLMALHGSVAAGGFFLAGFAVSTGGTAIPTPDQTSSINLASGSGKVALVQGTASLSGACVSGGQVIDAVGYGTTNCSELRAAPGGTSSAFITRTDACIDTNDNGADFSSSTLEPKNSQSAAQACSCTSVLPGFFTGVGGGSPLRPVERRVQPSLRWSSMGGETTCAFSRESAVLPAGMTRKDFLEKYVTHIVMHEIGHTLGLRHNFAGSLEGSSVMDYTTDGDAVRLSAPGAYDIAAVKFLYGLSTTASSNAFCTDDGVALSAACDRFDEGADPLTTQHIPAFKKKMTATFKREADLSYGEMFTLTRWVRGPSSEAQRLQAFNALVEDTAPPFKPEVLALGPSARAVGDLYNASFLLNLFVDAPAYRDEIGVDPLLQDDAFRARVIQVVSNQLTSSDNQRSFETMRPMVDVLKAMQHNDALAALLNARAFFVANRASYAVQYQPLVDDLVRRIDAATSPYFR